MGNDMQNLGDSRIDLKPNFDFIVDLDQGLALRADLSSQVVLAVWPAAEPALAQLGDGVGKHERPSAGVAESPRMGPWLQNCLTGGENAWIEGREFGRVGHPRRIAPVQESGTEILSFAVGALACTLRAYSERYVSVCGHESPRAKRSDLADSPLPYYGFVMYERPRLLREFLTIEGEGFVASSIA